MRGTIPIKEVIDRCKPTTSKDNPFFIDYELANECKNEKAWCICTKCGKCGRKFDKGFMIDDGGTTVKEGDEE